MTIKDDLGREVNIVNFPPKRIISVVPSLSELLFDLGLKEEIVGITKFCIFPEELFKAKPRIGGTKSLHIDKIIALQPDLILANKEENQQEDIEKLSARFPTYVSDIKTLEDAVEKIDIISRITATKDKGQGINQAIQREFASLERFDKRPKVVYMIWKSPMMVAGGDTFINDMIEKAGFENAFKHLSRYPVVEESVLKEAEIDYIFLSSEPFPFKKSHIGHFEQIMTASKATLVDGTMFSWYGSRLSKAATYFVNLRQELKI